jgi:hypothetical protein
MLERGQVLAIFYERDQFSGERFPVRPCLVRIIYVL